MQAPSHTHHKPVINRHYFFSFSGSGFGRANTLIKTNLVNLANPNETVTNTLNINTTTTSPNVTTTSNAMSFRQTLIQGTAKRGPSLLLLNLEKRN